MHINRMSDDRRHPTLVSVTKIYDRKKTSLYKPIALVHRQAGSSYQCVFYASNQFCIESFNNNIKNHGQIIVV